MRSISCGHSGDCIFSLAGDRRVLRGGAWNSSVQDCRAAKRIVFQPSVRRTYIGFRVARSR